MLMFAVLGKRMRVAGAAHRAALAALFLLATLLPPTMVLSATLETFAEGIGVDATG